MMVKRFSSSAWMTWKSVSSSKNNMSLRQKHKNKKRLNTSKEKPREKKSLPIFLRVKTHQLKRRKNSLQRGTQSLHSSRVSPFSLKRRSNLKNSSLKCSLREPPRLRDTLRQRSKWRLFHTSWLRSSKISLFSSRTRTTLNPSLSQLRVIVSTSQFMLSKKNITWTSSFMSNSTDKRSSSITGPRIRWRYSFSSPRISNSILNLIPHSVTSKVNLTSRSGSNSDPIDLSFRPARNTWCVKMKKFHQRMNSRSLPWESQSRLLEPTRSCQSNSTFFAASQLTLSLLLHRSLISEMCSIKVHPRLRLSWRIIVYFHSNSHLWDFRKRLSFPRMLVQEIYYPAKNTT